VLRAVVLTQYQRVTDGRSDGQTDDGIAVAITALAMRALRRAVKIEQIWKQNSRYQCKRNVSSTAHTEQHESFCEETIERTG